MLRRHETLSAKGGTSEMKTGEPIGPLILVADDDQDARELLAASLTRAGYRVETVADGCALVRAFAHFEQMGCRPFAVVTDIEMPHATGVEAVERLADGVPAIFVTAHRTGEMVERARALGIALFHKPLDFPRLRDVLAAHLG